MVDLIPGEIYTITDKNYPYRKIIHKFEKYETREKYRGVGYYLSDLEGSFKFTYSTPSFQRREIRNATFEEKFWLNKCIEENRLIPFEAINFKLIHEVW